MVEGCCATDLVVDFEFAARHRDGSEVLVDLNAQVVRDDDVATCCTSKVRPRTSPRGVSPSVRCSVRKCAYRTLVEHSQVGVYMMLDDHYTYVNQAFAAMFGYAEGELVGADFRVLVPTESQPHQEQRYQRQVAEPGQARRLRRHADAQGRHGASRSSSAPARIDVDGKIYTTGTIRDVTEQRHVQRQLEHNATHDLLTGLPNRVYFEQELTAVIAGSRASDQLRLRRAVSRPRRVQGRQRQPRPCQRRPAAGADRGLAARGTRRSALVARYGGDEFTLLPHGSCTRVRAEQLAQRVLTLLGGSFEVNGHRVFSGASLGVVLGRAGLRIGRTRCCAMPIRRCIAPRPGASRPTSSSTTRCMPRRAPA